MRARPGSVYRRRVERVSGEAGELRRAVRSDALAVEEPLEIRLLIEADSPGEASFALAVTMRTPG
ncbi:MAG: hypothetical protein M3483_07365, partial [Gemmatimonadota bacterium]|nr:hypothetical protein [Gemmatimonadota bacterium]